MMSRMAPLVQRTSLASARRWELEMHSAQRSLLSVPGNPGLGDDRLQVVLFELFPAKAAGEEASFVLPPFEIDDEGPLRAWSR